VKQKTQMSGSSAASPFFSILVPTYNQAQYLAPALDSILAQTEQDWEAVVVNDGSTDDTAEVAQRYADRDSRIRVLHQANGGVAAALNTALDNALGEWVCWLSSDDLFAPRKLEINRRWIGKYQNCKFFFSYFRLLRDATSEISDHDLWGPLPPREWQVLSLFYRNYISGITICVERAAWNNIGRFDPALRYAQDYDMWLRLLSSYPAEFVPEWLVINRNHAAQGSEVFPQACYYDTARAAIEHLNRTSFPALVPVADLSDPVTALRTVARALGIAAEPSSFVYGLGPHNGLLVRILEWVFAAEGGSALERSGRDRLIALVRRFTQAAAERHADTAFGDMWAAAARACRCSAPRVSYRRIEPVELAGLCESTRPEAPLRQYLTGHLGRNPGAALTDPRITRRRLLTLPFEEAGADHGQRRPEWAVGDRGQVVFLTRALAGGGAERVTHDLAHALAARGIDVRVAYLFDSPPTYRFHVPVYSLTGAAPAVQPCDQPPIQSALRLDRRPAATSLPSTTAASVRRRLGRRGAAAYHRLPLSVRQRLRLGDKLRAWRLPSYRILSKAPQPPVALPTPVAPASRGLPPPEALFSALAAASQHLKALAELVRQLDERAIIVSVMEEAAVRAWLLQAECRRRHIAWLHSVESYNLALMHPDWTRLRAEQWALTGACRGADRVVVPSQGCREDLNESFGIDAAHVEVLHNPVDCLGILLRSTEPLGNDLLRLCSGRAVFVSVGRLSPDKDHSALIAACVELRRRQWDFVCFIVGAGPLKDTLQCEIDSTGLSEQVVLLGESSNPYPLMTLAHALVLTSRAESFALVLVEAMLCGTIPIAVDCPTGPREVLAGGDFGVLVPPGDPAALADAMESAVAVRDRDSTRRRLGLERAFQFDLALIAERWSQLLGNAPERVIKQHAGSVAA
jgi:glycosyltransferase involved in cell wall biosynthesis/GT2 family glycosyltransferase